MRVKLSLIFAINILSDTAIYKQLLASLSSCILTFSLFNFFNIDLQISIFDGYFFTISSNSLLFSAICFISFIFVLKTILTNITKEMKVYNEEVFGPVIPIIGFDTIEEAIELANDTEYGLGGYVYTKDRKKFDIVVKKLKTGMIAWNNLYYLRPCNPFGGYKKSGIGRNNSEYGLKELCNIKVITYEK